MYLTHLHVRVYFFFFKQKTAYEMRISDWSSDVCSSDLDSIQTLWTEALTAAPGSVSQVRESAARLVRYAKETGAAVFLVGHVTKEGGIAGPRVLEHMVDAVLYFEGDSGSRFRVLRAFKNRFGAVNELGVFAMGEKGLKEVPNPSAIFLSGGSTQQPGSCVMVTREGTQT